MADTSIRIGQTELKTNEQPVQGSYVQIEGEDYYRIANSDRMRPFFMTVVSDSDHWLFISSRGPLTAGRRNPENALFPYTTDDKIHDAVETTGSKTILRVERSGQTHRWEPFSERYADAYLVRRNLYKNIPGNKLIFEEVNEDLGLTFRYGWFNSDRFGFVRRSRLINNSGTEVSVDILDGIQNLLPYGVNKKLQTEQSTLIDAYKKNELLPDTGLGLYTLSSVPVDKAEPSEALRATTVWSTGLPEARRLLCSLQLDRFRRGQAVEEETDVRAERGAYFLSTRFSLAPDAERTWYLVAELRQGPEDVARLRVMLEKETGLGGQLETDITRGTDQLRRIVGSADGLQQTADRPVTHRHFANVLFNVMRGGIFPDGYAVQITDFLAFLKHSNHKLATKYTDLLSSLPATIDYRELLQKARDSNDPDLLRQCYEYLPLTFSRRHGDPSRPWNRFSIELRNEDGSRSLYYQGNWRDIFQNWEALSLSYPDYIESMIAKFVNASTVDGYNPYRITRDGIDWEVVEPDDPWSYIGYWGDHQIIYLQKLMEVSQQHHPGALREMLTRPVFAYANVPYRIKPYGDLVEDPHNTVDFDEKLEKTIQQRVKELGSDGKLLPSAQGEVYRANLTEKLLVSVLAKLSNFIPEGGIWLNTQRPEWNDANNALVGRGVSMVTLYYLRRFLLFCNDLFGSLEAEDVAVSSEVADLFKVITENFEHHQNLLTGPLSGRERRIIVDNLGRAGSHYRLKVYEDGFSGQRVNLGSRALQRFCEVSLRFIDHSIRANERDDHLYHSYNLLDFPNEQELTLKHLYPMLEGQVAVLSAGLLPADAVNRLLTALRHSDLYRADQHTYLLYPDRQLPRFTEKNNIPKQAAKDSPLIQQLIADDDRRLVVRDVAGRYHFNGDFHNANDVKAALRELEQTYPALVEAERRRILDLFESIFDHESFTGRSGTFYGYEGLGCIYWHMVSKLILAAAENCEWAREAGAGPEEQQQLTEHYYDLRAGLGTHKAPEVYGAFPSDPYSHTPGNAGAQQPGMTGQVKEDILSRFMELGLQVREGRLSIEPFLLEKEEFLTEPAVFHYYDLSGEAAGLELPAGALAFTYCQVPFVYHRSGEPRIELFFSNGKSKVVEGSTLSPEDSRRIFGLTGEIVEVKVEV